MFYTLIKHGFSTNQSARMNLSKDLCDIMVRFSLELTEFSGISFV